MTIDEFNEWIEQLDKYAKVLRDYGRLLTAIEDIKAELKDISEETISKPDIDAIERCLKIIDKHINREE